MGISLLRTRSTAPVLFCLLLAALMLALGPLLVAHAEGMLPLTGRPAFIEISSGAPDQAIVRDDAREAFIASVVNGNPDQIVGVYVADLFSLPVVQQPAGNPGFVSARSGQVTQFGMAARYGSIALMAHNNLSGALFYQLQRGDYIDIIYGDGTVEKYLISGSRSYQALSPNSPYSAFLDLDSGGKRISGADLFYSMYAGDGRLVFQTCIERNGIYSWGRYFVFGYPAGTLRKMQDTYAVLH
jgi:hypothetical protein